MVAIKHEKRVIVWFRSDLRISDNPMLSDVVDANDVLPVFILERGTTLARASDWWLHFSLKKLAETIARLGSRLLLYVGDPRDILPQLCEETGIMTVAWNRLPMDESSGLISSLQTQGIDVHVHNGCTLFPLRSIKTGSGTFYQVFTPFSQAALKVSPELPLPTVKKLPPLPPVVPSGVSLDELDLLPKISWDQGIAEVWRPGEDNAQKSVAKFCAAVAAYKAERDFPAVVGTSRLSPYLRHGELSVRQLWYEVARLDTGASRAGVETYQKELLWREFAYNILSARPDTVDQPLRPEFKQFPWRSGTNAKQDLQRWQKGMTGYPIVDAGMRELWHTGWMHNRVRMIVASFLVKHLLIHWRHGAEWFQDTLVDFDIASNSFGWQWSAGCGADAAPFFRIFNPVTQSEKFDPDGEYIKRWVPELAGLTKKEVHTPWLAKKKTPYPAPMVDHKFARERALDVFSSFRR